MVENHAAGVACPLPALRKERWGRVCGYRGPANEAAWLAAVGLSTGDRVVVLRAALLGGPLHVRTGAGGEFAIDRGLAARIEVQPLPGEA